MTTSIVIPSSKDDLKAIQAAMKECSDSFHKIAAEREYIKDVVTDLAEKYELPKKFLNKMARTYFKGTFDKEASEHDDFGDLYTAVTEAK